VNIIFIEPAFPANQREFVRGLAAAGATVIGIGERPVDYLDQELRDWMLHYQQIGNVTDVGTLVEAVRFAQSRVWIDALESTIEAHTMAAAQAREACGIPGTSVRTAYLCRDKPSMKEVLRDAGIPTALSTAASSAAEVRAFAAANGVELVDQKYFYTEERWQALQKMKEAEKSGGAGGKKFIVTDQDRHGTVGAVALDKNGNLAAATSTGGTTNKKAGRVGDSPIIGGGTYANNATCAVSATGDGEYFIRSVVAHDVSALMEYRGMKLQEAAQMVLDKVAKLGGTGGLIAIDHDGNIALPFNTSGMYRGHVGVDGEFVVEIYR